MSMQRMKKKRGEGGSQVHAVGDREPFSQDSWTSDDADGVGVEDLDPPYGLFGAQ